MKNFPEEQVSKCIENICRNFNIAGVHFTRLTHPVNQPDIRVMFIDAAASIMFLQSEIEVNIETNGVKSKKDYRALRNLIKTRLRDAAWDLKCLAEDTLKFLGEKNVRTTQTIQETI